MTSIFGRLRWPWKDGRSPCPPPSDVLTEAGAIITGTAADRYATAGRPVPYWAWLNAVAHRPPDSIRALASTYPPETWARATMQIADELDRAGPAEARAIQFAVLVPAELDALASGRTAPDAVVRAVRRVRVELSHRDGGP